MATDTLWAQSEVIRKKALPRWEREPMGTLFDLLKSTEVTNIGERDFRIQFKTASGSRFGVYNPHFGDRGRGGSMKGGYGTAQYIDWRLNFEVSQLETELGEDKSVSTISKFKTAVAEGYADFREYLNSVMHSDGTARLATATAHSVSGGKSIYTLDTAVEASRLKRYQYVSVYASALASQKSNAQLYIESIEYPRVITLSGEVPSGANTDEICFEGVSGATPAGMTGLYYVNDSATSGTTFGINRATESEVRVESVAAGGAGLTNELVMLLKHKMGKRRGKAAAAGNLIGLIPFAQQATIWKDLMSIQQINVGGNAPAVTDRLPKLKMETFQYCGITHHIDPEQRQDRIDYIDPASWGKATRKSAGLEIDFAKTPGTNERFYTLYGGSGAPAAGVWFGFVSCCNTYSFNPGRNGFISGLAVDSDYTS